MIVRVQFDAAVGSIAGATEAVVSAETIHEALIAISRAFPPLQGRLMNCEGELRSVFRLKRNNAPAGGNDLLADGDTLLLEAG